MTTQLPRPLRDAAALVALAAIFSCGASCSASREASAPSAGAAEAAKEARPDVRPPETEARRTAADAVGARAVATPAETMRTRRWLRAYRVYEVASAGERRSAPGEPAVHKVAVGPD